MIVALFVLYAAWRIIKDAFDELLDKCAGEGVRQQISEIVMSVSGVASVHAVRTRKMGPGIYLDLHLLVDGNMTVRAGHDIAENVKQVLLRDGPNVLDAVVHLEPA
jgi:divalent metal cation (Fe/Co/Zn/Cd) transporter